jgi:Tol biopolymer transport system component
VSSISRARLLATVGTIALAVGLTTAAVPATAATPTDAGRLAFVRQNQIYTSTTTGTAVHKLTSSGKNFRPHWSPDGKRIAFVHEAPAAHRDIWVMNADGSHKAQVTHLGDTTEPTWSPDGKWLAFGANGTPPYPNYLGGRLTKIRSTAPFGDPVVMPAQDELVEPFVDDTLDWSPDGTKIAFASLSYPDSPDHYLLVYVVATGEVVLRDAVGGSCCGEGLLREPAWSHDSSSIALSYEKYDEGETPPAAAHIARLRYPDDGFLSYPDHVGDRDPDFSPTGKKIVFSHWSRIYTSDVNGSHRTLVTTGYHPDWQPVVG